MIYGESLYPVHRRDDKRKKRDSDRSAQDHGHDVGLAGWVVRGLTLAVVLAAPWAFGGYYFTRYFWPLLVAALAIWTFILGRKKTPAGVAPLLLAPFALALAFCAAQTIPMDVSTLERIDPVAAVAWKGADFVSRPAPARMDAPDLAAATAFPVSLDPDDGRMQSTWLLLGLATFFIGAHFFRQPIGAKALFIATASLGGSLAFFGLVQMMRWNRKLYWVVELTQGGEPFGPFVNRNHCGAMLNMCLAGGLGLLFWLTHRDEPTEIDKQWSEFDRPPSRWLVLLKPFENFGPGHVMTGLCAILIISGMLASGSRGAVVSGMAATVVVVVASLLPRRRGGARTTLGGLASVAFVAVVGIGLVAWLGLDDRVWARLSRAVQRQDELQIRTRHWAETIRAVPDFKWTGAGLGSYRHVHQAYTKNNGGKIFQHGENTYLEILVDLGVPGAAILAAALAISGWTVIQLLRYETDRVGRAFSLASLFVLVSQAAHGAGDFALYMPANLMMFCLWMGAASGRACRLATEQGRHAAFVRLPLVGGGFATPLILAGILAAGIWAWRQANQSEKIEWAMRNAELVASREKPDATQVDAAVSSLGALLTTAPTHAELQWAYSEALVFRARTALAASFEKKYKSTLKDKDKDKPLERNVLEAIWANTDPIEVHRLIVGLQRAGNTAALAELAAEPAMKDLDEAREHLRVACRWGPLLAPARLRLAELWFPPASPLTQIALLEQVRRIKPGDAETMYRVGVLDYFGNRPAAAAAAWRQSLSINEKRLMAVFRISFAWLGLKSTIDSAIPDDPEYLYKIALADLSAGKTQAERKMVLLKALADIGRWQAPQATKLLIQARLNAELGRNDEADAAFESLVNIDGASAEARHAFAEHLAKTGRKNKAFEQSRIASILAPQDGKIVKLFNDLLESTGGAEKGPRKRSSKK